MTPAITFLRRLLLPWLLIACGAAQADDPLRIAVAANFKPVLESVVARLKTDLEYPVTISAGSTGALFAQIYNGAPFDIFFSADRERPEKLESGDLTRYRQTYAYGQLAFWQPAGNTVSRGDFEAYTGLLAIANPRLAPYGRAASEILGDITDRSIKLIRGNNIAQAYTFVKTGNVPAGLVALSQLIGANAEPGTYWIVPSSSHSPIEQQLVIMKSADTRADDFISRLNEPDIKRRISASGYALPAETKHGS